MSLQDVAPDYPRLDYQHRTHHQRFAARVEAEGVPCQSCGGAGGWVESLGEIGGPWMPCGWCEGTGRVTRWLRGFWLRFMRDEKRRKAAKPR